MTVINAMKFNENQGAIISDEQTSFGGRKEDTARKLAKLYDDLGTIVISGGAGFANVNKESTNLFIETIKGPQNFASALNYFASIFNQTTNKAMGAEMFKKFGDLSTQEVIAGKLKDGRDISPNVIDNYLRYLDHLKSDYSAGLFLVLGKDKDKGLELYAVEGTSPIPIRLARNYQSIGSGSDISSLELSKFSSDLTREQRENINPVDGLITLLYATHLSSKINAGVGGIPEIAMINNNKLIMPAENSCQLSKEIAIAGLKGLLRKEYINEAIDSLILKNESFDSVNPSMWKEAKDNNTYDKLNLFLRGYKV